MEFTELGSRFVLAVEDLSGVWAVLWEHLKKRLPLRQATFKNKFGLQTTVDELPVQFLSSNDPRLQKLRQYAHSPVTWFRTPFVHLVLVSCEEGEEYKRAYRAQLRALAEAEGRPGVTPELLFVYVRPGTADVLAKGPAKVFDAMRRDLNLKKRDRCVRLDPVPPDAHHPGLLVGLEELCNALKDALRASFEARAAAYDEEVRRLMLSRQDPSWSFSSLFLFKDSLAVMMEAGGLLDDALREYSELEAVYLEVLGSQGRGTRAAFGGKAPGADEAALMWQPWHGIRQAVLQSEWVPEFAVRQFLFASQARVLLKQHRLVEVAERGLSFIQTFSGILEAREREGQVPPQFGAAWAFAAALSLAGTLSTLQARRVELRRTEQGRGPVGRRRSRLQSISSRPSSPSPGPASPNSASPTSHTHRGHLLIGQPQPPQQHGSGGGPAPGPVTPRSVQASDAAAASPTVLGSPDAGSPQGASGGGGAGGGVNGSAGAAGFEARVDWGLGALPSEEGWGVEGRSAAKVDGSAALYCLLGHLYSNARSELMALGDAVGLGTPQPNGAEVLAAAMQGGSALPTLPAPTPSPRPASTARSVSTARHSLLSPLTATPRDAAAAAAASAAASAAAGLPGSSSSLADERAGQPGSAGGAAEDGLAAVDLSGRPAGSRGPTPVPHLDLTGAMESQAADAAGASPAGLEVRHARELSDASTLSMLAGADSARSLGMAEGGGGGAAGGVPRKLSVRTRAAAQDGAAPESQASTPKSTISQVSSSPTRAAMEHGAAGEGPHLLAARPQGSMADARAIEQQVMSPAAPASMAGSPEAGMPQLLEGTLQQHQQEQLLAELQERGVPGSPGAVSLPAWLVHWRLRLGLASEDLFCDLWRALSESAARCYGQCGRRRHAALLHADVADALMAHGDLAGAAELYYHQCRIALREGWYSLAAQTLPKLAACQLAVGGGGLAHTAAAMLAIPQELRSAPGVAAERTACQLLLTAAAAAEGGGGLLGVPPLLGQLEVGGCLVLPHLLSCHPSQALYSRFYGLTDAGGSPVLMPPAADAAQQAEQGGALAAAVGDVALLTLHVVSALPVELPLSGGVLTLGVMQQLTVMYTPRASAAHGAPPLAAAPLAAATLARISGSSVASAGPSTTSFQPEGSTPRGGATAGVSRKPTASTPVGGGKGPGSVVGGMHPDEEHTPAATGPVASRFISRWQEVEELQCRLVGVAALGASSTAGSGGGGGSGSGSFVLRPGVNVLTFLAAPVKRGLYVPKHVRGTLRGLQLHIDVQPPPSLLLPHAALGGAEGGAATGGGTSWPPLHASPLRRGARSRQSADGSGGGTPLAAGALGALSARGGGGAGADDPGWGDLFHFEHPPEDLVVMSVESARPRVALWLAAAGGAVVTGQRQWLGLLLRPGRDQLRRASLALTWPGAAGGHGHLAALQFGAGAGSVSVTPSPPKASLSASGTPLGGPRHRAAVSLGGAVDLAARLGGPSRLEAASVATLTPIGPAAVVAPASVGRGRDSGSGSGGGRAGAEVQAGAEEEVTMGEEGPATGGASWLLADPHEQQQLRLPEWAAERPACGVWWWVEAGSFTAAPEAVRIVAPGAHALASRSAALEAPGHYLSGELSSSAHAPPALDLTVNLEYDSGCHRSHTRALAVPVVQPFGAHAAARELPGGAVALQVVLQSSLAAPVVITGCSLSPQPGLVLRDSMAQRLGLMPLRLPAGTSTTLAFTLQLSEGLLGAGGSGGGGSGRFDRTAVAAKLAQAVKLQPSVLSVEYQLDSNALCGAAAPPLAAAPAVPGDSGDPRGGGGGAAAAAPVLQCAVGERAAAAARQQPGGTAACSPSLDALHRVVALAPPPNDMTEGEEEDTAGSVQPSSMFQGEQEPRTPGPAQPQGASSGSAQEVPEVQRCSFTHLMAFQLAPPEEDTQGALVLLRLLGPFTAVAGQPITLCWRLERSVAGAGAEEPLPLSPRQQDAVPLQYEVLAEGDSWRPLGRRSGRVSLGAQAGAVSTVEATWVPLLQGTLPVPTLRIQEVRCQELFDVGNENNFIRVLPAVDGHTTLPATM